MVNKFTRYYNQNRRMIWGVIIIIASIIMLIQLINNLVGSRSEKKTEANINTNINNIGHTELESTKSAVSGDEIAKEALEIVSEQIKQFVDYCNNGNIEEAYNIISSECKEQLYTSVEEFKEYYYDSYFGGKKKSYSVKNWTGNTYLVEFQDDLLSNAGLSANGKTSDYITVVEKNNEYKLNINSYIGRTQIEKTTEGADIAITVESRDTYMEYEIYNIKVKNNSDKRIILDPKENTKSTYIQDKNGTNYVGFLNEIPDEYLTINSKYERNLSIKFSNMYSTSRTIESLTFSNLITDINENIRLNFIAKI